MGTKCSAGAVEKKESDALGLGGGVAKLTPCPAFLRIPDGAVIMGSIPMAIISIALVLVKI